MSIKIPGFATVLCALTLILAAPEAGAQMKVSYENAPHAAANNQYDEVMPVFDGNLNEYLSARMRYPDSARARHQEGRVLLQFVVNPKGLVEDLHIVRSAGFPLLDEEALKLLAPMQTQRYWKPGTQKGKRVPVVYTLPITFRLD